MKIVKHPNGYYYCHFTGNQGPQKISLKTRNEREAKQKAREAGIDQIERLAHSNALTGEALTRALSGRRVTFRQALSQYKEHMQTIRRSSYFVDRTETVLTSFAEYHGLWGSSPASVSPKMIDQYVNRSESDAGLKTRKNLLYTLNTFFRFCAGRGWIASHPGLECRVDRDRLPVSKKEPKQRRPFTHAEYRRVLRASLEHPVTGAFSDLPGTRLLHKKTRKIYVAGQIERGEIALEQEGGQATMRLPLFHVREVFWRPSFFWHTAVTLAYHLGLRLSDIARLEWDCFQYEDRGQILIWTDKYDKRLLLQMPTEVSEAMKKVRMTNPIYCFPEQRDAMTDDNNPGRRSALSMAFGAICKRAKVEGKSFHCLRHSFATNRRELGDSVDEIREKMGHTHESVTKGYLKGGKK